VNAGAGAGVGVDTKWSTSLGLGMIWAVNTTLPPFVDSGIAIAVSSVIPGTKVRKVSMWPLSEHTSATTIPMAP
jgi:hypothetical protein